MSSPFEVPSQARLKDKPLAPGAMLGVLGGGQLGRMFAHAATQMGYRVTVLDPAPEGPAAEIATHHLQYQYDDLAGLEVLANSCDAVTTEFENVPAESLRYLQQRVAVSPPPEAVEIAQNRIREKTFFTDHQLPTNHFAPITKAAQIDQAFSQMSGKAVLKTSQFGYDGKGQQVCESAEQAILAFEKFGSQECVLEDFIAFQLEVSVVLARDVQGNVETFPVVENQHHNGILDTCIVPARVDKSISDKASALATSLANSLNYVGVLAVEMFVCNGDLLLNEIAPRPHNSGHYTLDATNYSQFDQQVRTLCGLPVAEIRQHCPVVMLNVLGDMVLADNFDWQQLSEKPDSHLHVYGKAEARDGRKMAHVNFLGDDTRVLIERVSEIKAGFS